MSQFSATLLTWVGITLWLKVVGKYPAVPSVALPASINEEITVLFGNKLWKKCRISGVVDESCQPDATGRQICLKPFMYPSDVVNILTETGGFSLEAFTCQGNSILVWSMVKWKSPASAETLPKAGSIHFFLKISLCWFAETDFDEWWEVKLLFMDQYQGCCQQCWMLWDAIKPQLQRVRN